MEVGGGSSGGIVENTASGLSLQLAVAADDKWNIGSCGAFGCIDAYAVAGYKFGAVVGVVCLTAGNGSDPELDSATGLGVRQFGRIIIAGTSQKSQTKTKQE